MKNQEYEEKRERQPIDEVVERIKDKLEALSVIEELEEKSEIWKRAQKIATDDLQDAASYTSANPYFLKLVHLLLETIDRNEKIPAPASLEIMSEIMKKILATTPVLISQSDLRQFQNKLSAHDY